jgi:hypothetical protein
MECLLIPIGYKDYPPRVRPALVERPGHFDITTVRVTGRYSLHTEYSAGARKWNSPVVKQFPALTNAQKHGVPELWRSRDWALQFAEFIVAITPSGNPPEVVEVHPPFLNYCPSAATFIDLFIEFEAAMKRRAQNTLIVIENRCGTRYAAPRGSRKSPFLVAETADILNLCHALEARKSSLGIALDIPQLLTAHGVTPDMMTAGRLRRLLDPLVEVRDRIASLHLWGKKIQHGAFGAAHNGDLSDYFGGREYDKVQFLACLREILSDGKRRYILPEVNSNAASISIVNDLVDAGFLFVQ